MLAAFTNSMRHLLAISFLLVVSSTASLTAQVYDRRDFETVLVPVAARDVSGVGGSLWRTSLYVYHELDPVVVIGYDTADPGVILPRHTYAAPLHLSGPGQPAGALLFVDKRVAGTTHYDLRVRDVSLDSTGPGVFVPVVREPDLLNSAAYLLAVPCNPKFRRMLRLYSPLAEAPTTFRLTITDDLTNSVIYSTRRQLAVSSETLTVPGMTVPRHPAELDLDLDQLVPSLSSYATVTIAVQPDDSSERFWSFVSVTDNVTQQVALVLP
jgi:hypothetical protein